MVCCEVCVVDDLFSTRGAEEGEDRAHFQGVGGAEPAVGTSPPNPVAHDVPTIGAEGFIAHRELPPQVGRGLLPQEVVLLP